MHMKLVIIISADSYVFVTIKCINSPSISIKPNKHPNLADDLIYHSYILQIAQTIFFVIAMSCIPF